MVPLRWAAHQSKLLSIVTGMLMAIVSAPLNVTSTGRPAPPLQTAPGRETDMVREAVLDVLDLLREEEGKNALADFLGAKAAPVLVDLWRQRRILPATFGGTLSKALAGAGISAHAESLVMPVAAAVYYGVHGPYIKLNLEGAFFKDSVLVWRSTNPEVPYGPRPIAAMHIGALYRSGSREARVVILLHELGHILDVLEKDSSSPEGRIISEKNTLTIISRCKVQLASLPTRETSLAAIQLLDEYAGK